MPPNEKSGESDEPRICVEYLENIWAIPLRECLTWFVSSSTLGIFVVPYDVLHYEWTDLRHSLLGILAEKRAVLP